MSETKVVLPHAARFSYPTLMEARANKMSGKEEFSLTLMIPKDTDEGKANIEALKAGISAAIEDGKTRLWGGQAPKNLRLPLLDGDGTTPNGEDWPPEYAGHWILRTKSNADYPPKVFDNTEGNRELKGAEIRKVYAGSWGSATLNFYAYDTAGNRGIGTGLLGVLFLHDGEPFSGATASASDFAAFKPASPVAADDPLAAMLG